MPINQWALDDRPREKLLTKGPEALSNSELIAILIQTGGKDRSAIDVAKEVLEIDAIYLVLACQSTLALAYPTLLGLLCDLFVRHLTLIFSTPVCRSVARTVESWADSLGRHSIRSCA